MSPQFVAAAEIICTEVERITDECLHVSSGDTAASATPAKDISHLPCGTVSSRLVDELRCKMNFGIIRPRVIFWVVFEQAWCFIVDGDGYCC